MFFFDVKLHSLQNQAFLECCTGQDYRCLNTRASKHLVLVLGGDWGWKNNSENRIYFVWKNLGKSPQKFSFYAMHKVGLSWNLHFREGGGREIESQVGRWDTKRPWEKWDSLQVHDTMRPYWSIDVIELPEKWKSLPKIVSNGIFFSKLIGTKWHLLLKKKW